MAQGGVVDEAERAATTVPETLDDRDRPGGLVGRFLLASVLGTGGMGVVFTAHDPLLDRRIALKLIRGRGAGAEARLLREAQAMARLAHPNVVTVHEAGLVDGSVFLAMELVDGSDLRAWLAPGRPWRQIVAVFVAAGRGLAAAHAAGLVHRDFKPANVFVDRGGAVKVGDFGLVGGAGEASDAVIGTPAYMAPEQASGLPIDARADQYAFCKSLAEALGDRARPRWLARALARGLRAEPAARHPSMTALCDRLEHAPARRRRIVVGVGALVALVGSAALAWRLPARAPSCDDAGDRAALQLAGIWDAPRAAIVRVHLAAVDPGGGAARFAAAAPLFESYARQWRAIHVDVCRANRVEVRQSDSLYDLRMRCLDRRRGELADRTAALAEAGDPRAVDRALVAAHQLGALSACSDAEALQAARPPPDDPVQRREAEAIEQALATVERDVRRGHVEGVEARSVPLVERARTLHHAPTLAHVLQARAKALLDAHQVAPGLEVLRELTEVAAEAHDDATAVWAWSQLLRAMSLDLGQVAQAVTLLPAARAALRHAGNIDELRVEFLRGEADVLYAAQRTAEAHARLAEARALLERQGAGPSSSPRTPRLASLYFQEARFHGMSGELAAARTAADHAIALDTAAYGADHPEVGADMGMLADVLRFDGKNLEAIAAYREVIRIRDARLGDSPVVSKSLISMSSALINLRRAAEALPLLDRAIRILGATHAWDSELGSALMVRGNALSQLRRRAEAERAFGEAIATFDRVGGEQTDLPTTLYNRGELYAGTERCAVALADYQRAAELYARERGAQHPMLIWPLAGLGKCLVELGRFREALVPIDRALALPAHGDQGALLALTRYYRGRALYESGRDRRAGLAIVRAARAEAVALDSPFGRIVVGDCDTWLHASRQP